MLISPRVVASVRSFEPFAADRFRLHKSHRLCLGLLFGIENRGGSQSGPALQPAHLQLSNVTACGKPRRVSRTTPAKGTRSSETLQVKRLTEYLFKGSRWQTFLPGPASAQTTNLADAPPESTKDSIWGRLSAGFG